MPIMSSATSIDNAIAIHAQMNQKGTDWLDQLKCKETVNSMGTDKKKML